MPLRKDGKLLGCISAFRLEVRPFSERGVALLENFAAQAVIAMENARLLTEQREALERQTATAEVLQVINSSPGDPAAVFGAILEKSTRLCDTAFGALLTYDGELWRPAAVHGPAALAEFFMNRPPWRPAPESGIGRHIGGEDIVHFADLAATDLYAQKDPGRIAYVELGQARTTMSLALRKDDILLGAVQVYRQDVRSFGEREIALLQSFAAQAVIAMENARLLNEQREALEQQTATAKVLQVINANPGNLAPVFDTILQKAHSLCAAAMGSLVLGDGDRFRLAASHGIPERFVVLGRRPFPLPASIRRLIDGERLCHFPDVQATDPEHDHEVAYRFYRYTDLRVGLESLGERVVPRSA